jgi:hypothetical protein
MKMVKGFSMICVDCGKSATKGSMKHPYCVKCFKKRFNNNYDKYEEFMLKTHGTW